MTTTSCDVKINMSRIFASTKSVIAPGHKYSWEILI